MDLSIIIVNYFSEKELLNCLKSIFEQKTKFKFEVIVVDNGSEKYSQHKTKYAQIKDKYAKVIYIKSPKNLGFGAGNNLGSKSAKGKYLFFLNPDTKLYYSKLHSSKLHSSKSHPSQLRLGCLDSLIGFMDENKNCGIVAPSLVHANGDNFLQQGSLILTPIRAISAHSIFNKLWPKNPIAKRFWLDGVDKTKNRQVEVVPGTAFVISKKLFEGIGKFDENFFLYFEEYDLCKRVMEQGKELWMLGDTKVFHEWGVSAKKNEMTAMIYKQSFLYYLTKHYGLLGVMTFLITQVSAYFLLAIFLLVIILFLYL